MSRKGGLALAAVSLLAAQGCEVPVPDSGLRLIFEPAPGAAITPDTGLQMARVFEKRLGALDVRGARVTAIAGSARVAVDLPGGRPGPARRLLARSGRLELRVVEDRKTGFLEQLAGELPPSALLEHEMATWSPAGAVPVYYLASQDPKALRDAIAMLHGNLPAGTELLVAAEAGHRGSRERTYLVGRKAELTGEYITEARVRTDEMTGRPHVAIALDERGAKIFEDLTARIVKRRLAIVIDGEVSSAPVVQERIPGGRLQITLGGMVKDLAEARREAEELAMALWSGALPCPVVLAEETTYGPASR